MTIMTILVHTCCGPCSVYPLGRLLSMGLDPVAYFHNPNIHPYMEFERRVEAMEAVATAFDVAVIWDRRGYGLERWLAQCYSTNRRRRCESCYRLRIEETADQALSLGAGAFTTTLLYSVYQDHDLIKAIGLDAAAKRGIEFFYEDFRKGWRQGIEESKRMGIYRQPYCGCVASEMERYSKRGLRLAERLAATESNLVEDQG